jgi:type IV secretion system protein VirB10
MKRGTLDRSPGSITDTSASRMSSDPSSGETVRGERGPTSVGTPRSLQSRVSSIMACSLMIILGAGMLTWYYTNAISRLSRVKRNAQAASAHKAQGEMPLPALDGFNSLKISTVDPRHPQSDVPADSQIPAGVTPPLVSDNVALSARAQALPLMQSVEPQRRSYGGHARRSAEQLEEERLLSGAAFARESGSGATVASTSGGGEFRNPGALETAASGPAGMNSAAGDIGPLLRTTAVASARAQVLPTRRFLLPKGAFIDCTLETAIDSTLPGMTTCITATDTFGSDGTVVLLERGTKLIGETRGQVQQGVARVFVVWTEARTPTGIVVPLDSPGADELGRSGLPGEINRHFWDRFGAAILISTLDGAVQAGVQSASHGGGAIIYNPSTSESVMTDVLKSSVNIPPTITKQNGDRIQVFVARDLDFRPVYELRSITTPR